MDKAGDIFDQVLKEKQKDTIRNWKPESERPRNLNAGDSKNVMLKRPPIIPTSLTVHQIVGDYYEDYLTHLENYQRLGMSWNEYAIKAKITSSLRREFAKILRDLHDNGFYGPEAINGEIVCYTLVEAPKVKKRGGP